MEAAGYYIFYVINRVMTLLPLSILYIFADLLYVLICYFPGYRKRIVKENLRNAFPEKTAQEISQIARKFYRHLADMLVETLKMTTLSSRELCRRVAIENSEILERIYNEGRDVAAILGHYNNWEWLTIITLKTQHKCISIYKPLKNKHFDRFLTKIRSRHGMTLTPMSIIVRELINCRKQGIPTLSAFLADQTPAKGDIHYWTTFLNQDTPVYLGAEKIASKYDMAVVFFNHQKVRRGYYRMSIELLFEHSSGLPEHSITEAHVRRLDEIIRQQPEYWVWSHRRWKYKRESRNG